MITAEEIQSLIQQGLECTHIEIEAYEGDDHFRAVVVSSAFAGISRLSQHRLVYEQLQKDMKQAIHALQLDTWAPLEWEDKKNKITAGREYGSDGSKDDGSGNTGSDQAVG